MDNNIAVITAGGSGKRFSRTVKKQFVELNGTPVIIHTMNVFVNHQSINSIYLTVPVEEIDDTKELVKKHFPTEHIYVIAGGIERQQSVLNALLALPDDCDYVLIHDGVRPLISSTDIDLLLKTAKECQSAIPVHKVKNTIKEVSGNKIVKTIPRDNLVEVYTPQVFSYRLIKEFHLKAGEDNLFFTDDAGLLEHYGLDVYTCEISAMNIKITTLEDLELVELLINKRRG